MAATYNFSIDAGSDYSFQIQYLDATNTPISLTGASIVMTVREQIFSDCATEFTTSNGKITITNAPNGIFMVTLSGSDTTEWSKPTYQYDIFVYFTSSQYKILGGTITVIPAITR